MKKLSKHCSNCSGYFKARNKSWGLCEYRDWRIDDDNYVCEFWEGKKYSRKNKYNEKMY